MENNYSILLNYLSERYEEIDGLNFYRDLFPCCENEGELNSDYSKPNAIYLYSDRELNKKRRRIMLDDKWSSDYYEYVKDNEGTLCGGLAYRGRANKII